MKVLLIFNDQKLEQLSAQRPQPLHLVAGAPILEHVLYQFSDLIERCDELIVPLTAANDPIQTWFEERAGQLPLRFIHVDSDTELDAVRQALAAVPGDKREPIILASGHHILIAPFSKMLDFNNPVSVLRDDEVGVGVLAFKEQRTLKAALENGHNLNDLWKNSEASGLAAEVVTADHWIEIDSTAALLKANHYLLSLGYGSEDALERSYIESFTVISPVHIHPDAIIDASVIGPYTTIGANAVVKNSVLSECVVGENAKIENCILDHSAVGIGAQITGQVHQLIVQDGAENKLM